MLSPLLSRLLPFGIGLTLLGGGCLPTQPTSNIPTSDSTASVPVGWQTYTNPVWHATIAYPPVLEQHPKDVVASGATLDGDFLAYFQYPSMPKDTNLEQASFSLITDCKLLSYTQNFREPSSTLPSSLVLGGKKFDLEYQRDAAMSHSASHRIYVYKEGDRCLGLALSTFETDPSVYENPPSRYDAAPLEKIFLDSIKTLYFTK